MIFCPAVFAKTVKVAPYTKKKTAEFNSHIALLFDHLHKVLSDLDKIYQKKKKALSPKFGAAVSQEAARR